MTFQTPEIFIYKGHAFQSSKEPLRDLLKQRGLETLHVGGGMSSACWRGYIGTWHITKGKLFLIELSAPSGDKEIELTAVFPECETRVFAHWFTGKIKLPIGRMIRERSVMMELVLDPSVYEGYHELDFERGTLISARQV